MPWGEFLTYVGQAVIVVLLLVFVGAIIAGILQVVRGKPAPGDPQETHERLLSGAPCPHVERSPGGRCVDCGQQA